MKRIKADEKTIVFQLAGHEREALDHVLQTYPVVPPAHRQVTRGLKEPEEYQRCLDEALEQQRAAHKNQLRAWLATPDRFEKFRRGYRLVLQREDAEWLLQVLNDIRVGHWLLLGSPESTGLILRALKPDHFPQWFALHMSGYFQMAILEALES